MRAKNNYLVDFSKGWTYVGSESLVQEAKSKHSDIYLNFANTSYGGSFLDKVIISYFKENYPENIVYERTSWKGENAFAFGEPAKKLYELIIAGNILDFYYLGQYYTETKYNIIADTAQQYINDNGLDNELYDIVCDWLSENSYPEPNYLDYSENDLNDFLQKLK